MRGRAVLAAVLLAGTAAAGEEVRWETTDDGRVRFALPVVWRPEAVGPSGKLGLLAFECRLAPGEDAFRVELWDLAGAYQSPRAMAYYERKVRLEEKGVVSAEVVLDPLPHLLVREDEGRRLRATAYAVSSCHGLALSWEGPAALWEREGDRFLRAASSLEAHLPLWPPPPEGYASVKKGDYLYLLAPGVPKSAVRELHAVLKEAERKHKQRHGPLPRALRRTSQIVVHARKEEAAPLSKKAAESRSGFYLESGEQRLYAVPLETARSYRADLAMECFRLMHMRRYASPDPWWLYVGEATIVWSEESSGREPPELADGIASNIPGALVPFRELAAAYEMPGWRDQIVAYLVFFRMGPRPYRAAFRAFLKEVQATGDWELAQETHLFALDQQKLKAAAERFVERRIRATR